MKNDVKTPLTIKVKSSNDAGNKYEKAAKAMSQKGFKVIPILPHEKRPPCRWDNWESDSSNTHIEQHWSQHPEHQLGILTDSQLIVLDADSFTAVQALKALEKAFEINPNLIVKTSKGEHHYFARPLGVVAKLQSYNTNLHPERIDIKTGRSLVVVPPSDGKSIVLDEISHISELRPVTQEFVDAIMRHNGVDLTSSEIAQPKKPTRTKYPIRHFSTSEITAYLNHIDPDCGYQDWVNIGMALHNEYEGSNEGFEIYDTWSAKGSKYSNTNDLHRKWQSFDGNSGPSITVATIKKLAKDAGADVEKIAKDNLFDPVPFIITKHVVPKHKVVPSVLNEKHNPLAKFAINDNLDELKKEAKDALFIIKNMALAGQLTNFYAKPNTGKTLLTLHAIVQQIQAGDIQGEDVFFINADDSFTGLIAKTELLCPFKINVLAPGHNRFKTKDAQYLIHQLISGGHSNAILIFDTLKKFVDVMSKSESSNFWRVLREFSACGGTVINLAHTNKNDGQNGKPIYAGTTDSLDDADCAYTMRRIEKDGAHEAIVEFENIKNRGNVSQKTFMKFSVAEGLSYQELFDSVKAIDASEIEVGGSSGCDEQKVVEAITDCIAEGTCRKMELARAASEATGIGRNRVIEIINKHAGDGQQSKWNFTIAERGAKIYHLLSPKD
jgi:hypothetical protein